MRTAHLLSLLVLLLFASTAVAEPLPAPSGSPVLVISGKIGVTNADGVAQFDRAMLEAMMDQTIQTKTPWHDGQSVFEGVGLDKLMDAVGATGDTVTAIALNDYVTEIPISDFAEFGPILALKRNGEFLSVRDKGPLFIIYPYESTPELQTTVYFARSAWQVVELVVK